MANTILTPTAVTREALRVLHQKLNFIGTITRDYDDSYAKQGAKIGDTLKIRLPNQYTVRTGATLSAQDTTESSVSLQLATQKGVDVNFTSNELTLSLDDFSKRIIQPAMAVLASNIESDAMSMYKDVYQQVNNVGAAMTFNKVLQGRKILNDALTPMDDDRSANLNTQDNIDLVDALKGLFQDASALKQQYREGMMGRTAGFDFYENTLWPTQTVGTKAGSPVVNGGAQTGASLVTNGWTASSAVLKRGDVFTIASVFKVHPETKNATSLLQQFVVTADTSSDGTGNATIPISPSITVSGATQNVERVAGELCGHHRGGNGLDRLWHFGRLPQECLRLRHRRPGDARWRRLRLAPDSRWRFDAHRAPVRHQQRQVPLSHRCPLWLQDDPGATRLPAGQQLILVGEGRPVPPHIPVIRSKRHG